MQLVYQFLLSLAATIGFAVYFNAPLASIIPTGFLGGLSWSLYYVFFKLLDQKVLGAFMAAFLVGSLGELLSIVSKKPATVFITPGIVPLVPGAGMYYTMLYLVEENFEMAISKGVETFFIAASISIGIITSTIFSRGIRSFSKYD